MTDQQLSAKLAEAVRGVWPTGRVSIGLGYAELWTYPFGKDWCIEDTPIHPRWAAVILLHELERMARGTRVAQFGPGAPDEVARRAIMELLNEA